MKIHYFFIIICFLILLGCGDEELDEVEEPSPVTAENNGKIFYMTIGEYILLALAIIIPTILFILSLVLFYSQLFKATLPTLFALILTIGAGFLLTILIPWSGLN